MNLRVVVEVVEKSMVKARAALARPGPASRSVCAVHAVAADGRPEPCARQRQGRTHAAAGMAEP